MFSFIDKHQIQQSLHHLVTTFMFFRSLRDLKKSLSYVTRIYVPSFLTNFWALYLSEFLTDLGQILDYKSYDQA